MSPPSVALPSVPRDASAGPPSGETPPVPLPPVPAPPGPDPPVPAPPVPAPPVPAPPVPASLGVVPPAPTPPPPTPPVPAPPIPLPAAPAVVEPEAPPRAPESPAAPPWPVSPGARSISLQAEASATLAENDNAAIERTAKRRRSVIGHGISAKKPCSRLLFLDNGSSQVRTATRRAYFGELRLHAAATRPLATTTRQHRTRRDSAERSCPTCVVRHLQP